MRFTLSFLLVLGAVGCGGSGKSGGGAGGTGTGGTGAADMSVSGGGGGNGGRDGGFGSIDMAAQCDIVAQTGCPAGDKCVASHRTTICVPNGTVAEGASCTVTTTGTGTSTMSSDNCAAGLVCDSTGVAAPICHKICSADSACSNGQLCAARSTKPAYGECVTSCKLFATGGCPTGMDCASAVDDISTTSTTENGFFVCKTTGTGAELSSCTKDSDCGAGLECDGNTVGGGSCLPNCDATHACPPTPMLDGGMGMISCQVFGNQNGEGYCSAN